MSSCLVLFYDYFPLICQQFFESQRAWIRLLSKSDVGIRKNGAHFTIWIWSAKERIIRIQEEVWRCKGDYYQHGMCVSNCCECWIKELKATCILLVLSLRPTGANDDII